MRRRHRARVVLGLDRDHALGELGHGGRFGLLSEGLVEGSQDGILRGFGIGHPEPFAEPGHQGVAHVDVLSVGLTRLGVGRGIRECRHSGQHRGGRMIAARVGEYGQVELGLGLGRVLLVVGAVRQACLYGLGGGEPCLCPHDLAPGR